MTERLPGRADGSGSNETQRTLGNNKRHMEENKMEGRNTRGRFSFDRNSVHPGYSEQKASEAMLCLEKPQES
jgi:hypothetical protein